MSLDIKKSSFQILVSLTTVVQPEYCHLKSKVAAQLMLTLSCWVLVWCSTLHRSTNHGIHRSTVIWKWLQYQVWPQSCIWLL